MRVKTYLLDAIVIVRRKLRYLLYVRRKLRYIYCMSLLLSDVSQDIY